MFRHLPPTATPLPLRVLANPTNFRPANVADFRRALEEYLGVEYCFLASSGRTALFLLLSALKQNADPNRQTVILPAYTCPSLAKVVVDVGLRVRLVDLSPNAFTFDSAQLATAFDKTTLAVLCVHPFGIAQEVESICSMAHEVGALVVEDAAQSLGSRVAGKALGTVGDYGLFSLGPGKTLSTGGGGMITINGNIENGSLIAGFDALAKASPIGSFDSLLRIAAFTTAFQPNFWWLATRLGAQRVGENEESWGYRLTSLTSAQAGVGLQQLDRLDGYNQQRRARAMQIIDSLRAIDLVQFFPDPTNEAIYLRLPLLAQTEAMREDLYQRLWRAGVGVGRLYQKTIGELFQHLQLGTFANAESMARRLLTLPTHHFVSDADIERMVRVVKEYR